MTPGHPVIDARIVKRLPAAAESEAFELNIHLRTGAGITVLLGPSGSGKTLTLNCLGGFTRPDEGRILVNDKIYFDDASQVHLAPQQRRCGYIFQDHALFPHMTVRDNLRFASSSGGFGKNRGLTRRRRINELLDAFELTDLASRKPAQLSGGQKQRAALARILVSDPRVLLLDEPGRGLDARLRTAFYDVLNKARERLQAPVLLVTHDLEECFELADTVFLLDRGRFLQSGPKREVLSKPATTEIARSLGVYNIIPATITALDPGRGTSRLKILGHELEGQYLPGHLLGDQGFVCVRKSELKILPADGAASPDQFVLRVRDASVTSRGVRVAFEQDITAVISEAEFSPFVHSERLRIQIPPSAVYFVGR